MSNFSITVYTHTNPEISYTQVVGVDFGIYGYKYNPDNIYGTTIAAIGTAYFLASVSSDCAFTRWVYRLGSIDSDTVHYSEDNPFIYSGPQDIFIRAEGENLEWQLLTVDSVEIPPEYSDELYISRNTLYAYAVNFVCAGHAKFEVSGEVAINLYLSTSLDWDSDSGYVNNPIIEDTYVESSKQFEYDVSPGITYYVCLSGCGATTGDSVLTGYTTLQIMFDADKPSDWSWTTNNSPVTTDTQTVDAFNAIMNNGYTTDFSYEVWNDLVKKTNEFLAYMQLNYAVIGDNQYGYSPYTAYGEMLKDAIMPYEDKTLYAQKFNILRYCIGSMVSTGLGDKTPGDPVIGNEFLILTEALNEI